MNPNCFKSALQLGVFQPQPGVFQPQPAVFQPGAFQPGAFQPAVFQPGVSASPLSREPRERTGKRGGSGWRGSSPERRRNGACAQRRMADPCVPSGSAGRPREGRGAGGARALLSSPGSLIKFSAFPRSHSGSVQPEGADALEEGTSGKKGLSGPRLPPSLSSSRPIGRGPGSLTDAGSLPRARLAVRCFVVCGDVGGGGGGGGERGSL